MPSALPCLARFCTPDMVGGVVILPSMSHLVLNHHHKSKSISVFLSWTGFMNHSMCIFSAPGHYESKKTVRVTDQMMMTMLHQLRHGRQDNHATNHADQMLGPGFPEDPGPEGQQLLTNFGPKAGHRLAYLARFCTPGVVILSSMSHLVMMIQAKHG
jgi:hypothetical protein